MANCSNIILPSDSPNGALDCDQRESNWREVKQICAELNALDPGGGGGGGGGGVVNLGDLGDVSISSPADGQVIVRRSGLWVNEAAPSGGTTITLDDTGDVAAGAANGTTTLYSFSGTGGATVSLSGTTIQVGAPARLTDLADYQVSAPTVGQYARFDNSGNLVSSDGPNFIFASDGTVVLGGESNDDVTVFGLLEGPNIQLDRVGDSIRITGTATGGGGGGAAQLDDLTDVTITDPQPGQVLTRAGSVFVNADLPASGTIPQTYEEYVFFNIHGVDNTGNTETSATLQAAVNQLLNEGRNITFPPGKYLVANTIVFASPVTKSRRIISGYGVEIIAARALEGPTWVDLQAQSGGDLAEEFKLLRATKNNQYPAMFQMRRDPVEWAFCIEGFVFVGNGFTVTGLLVSGMTQSEVRMIDFQNCFIGLKLSGWNNRITNLVAGGGYIGLWFNSNDGAGCTSGNNINTIDNCRVRGSESAYNNQGVLPYCNVLLEGYMNNLTQTTIEGDMYRFGVLISTKGNCMSKHYISRTYEEQQEWSQITAANHWTFGWTEHRKEVYFDREFPRYGLNVFANSTGRLVFKNVSLDFNKLPSPWTGISRYVYIEGTSNNYSGPSDAAALFARLGLTAGSQLTVNGARATA